MSTFLGSLCFIFFYVVTPASSASLTVNWSLGTDYTTLATGKSFAVGDTIVFNYGAGHTVDEVSENDYKSCTIGNSITSDSSGTTSISLKASGSRYFICGIPGHCAAGMKLAVNVASASSDGVGGGTTTPTTPTPSTGGGATIPTPFYGGGVYNPMTTQAIPCSAWTVSSSLRHLFMIWTVVICALALS